MGKESELFKAAQSGNLPVLEKFFASHLKKLAGGPHHGSGLGSIRNKLHPNIQDEAGSTLLHHAILNGHSEAVKLLLKCGASTKISDNSGSPPLHLAAWKGDLEVVQLLVTQGPSFANVNQQNDGDDTALHLASQYGYSAIVEFLLQRHADPLLRNVRDETALDLAAQYGHLSCVHFLISYSPESLRPTVKGFSPLHLAARNGHSIVALSLINAGISVNTVCDRGTALHEAAVCGKLQTVQLLLDKGVNSDLKDSHDRTVLEVLEQCNADWALAIRTKIQTHVEESQNKQRSTPTKSRVVAVARNTSQPLVEGSSALAFHTGDHIQVEREASSGVYVGSVRGKMGSFLAEDVLFYTEQEGKLVITKENDLHMSSENGAPPNGRPETPPHSSSDQAQEEVVKGSNCPHGDSVSMASDDVSSSRTDCLQQPQAGGDIFELSMSTSQKSQEVTPSNDPTKPPGGGTVTSDPASPKGATSSSSSPACEPAPVTLEPVGGDAVPAPSPGTTPTPIPDPASSDPPANPDPTPTASGRKLERDGSKRMSKKEKKFHLSKDDGRYAELNPINPHQAKQEYGDTMRLNPVGPAFGGVASSLEEGQEVGTSSSAVPQPLESNEEELMGSYYVLEVGNFDPSPPPSAGVEPGSAAGMESGQDPELCGSVAIPGEGGYFMLNTDDPTLSAEEEHVYSYIPQNRLTNYVNASILKPGIVTVTPSQGEEATPPVKEATPSSKASIRAVSPKLHPHLVIADDRELSRTGQTGFVQSEGRTSQYENVCPPGERDILPIPAAAVTTPIEGENLPGAYENVALKPPPTSPDPPQIPDKRRSAHQRGNVYEMVQLGKKEKGSRHSNCRSPEGGDLSQSGIVQNPEGNQFAGLIITASRQLEESLSQTSPTPWSPPGLQEAGAQRKRLDTLWDNTRVESEWTQIDSLLQDMNVLGDQPNAVSPVSPTLPVARGDRAELMEWLTAGGLLSCASSMEVHRFDNLRFLAGGILAMDDLADIGITTAEDQYNLMAAVSLLAPPPSVGHASTVVEWLGMLGLLELEGKFAGYSLRKISTLWDIELTSVVGVELLGYRKRLQYGIAELRNAHPEWVRHTPTSSPSKTKLSPKSKQTLSGSHLGKRGFVKDYRSLRSSAASTSASDINPTEIQVRSPAEAQSFVGDGSRQPRTPNLPSKTWRHSNSSLIKDCINYDIKYLGSVLIKTLHGNQSAEEACLKLRTSTENMQKVPAITLSISWKGVNFVDTQSKVVVSVHAIRDISCCARDIEDKRVFAYISKDRLTGHNYSHVFQADSEEVADDIRMTLGQAFEICYQKVMRARQTSTS